MIARAAARRPVPPPLAVPPLPRAEAVSLVAAVIAAASPVGSTAALGPLAAALVQLGDRGVTTGRAVGVGVGFTWFAGM